METMRKLLRRKLVGLSVLVAVIALMVPMAVALAGSDETEIKFSGERTTGEPAFIGNTLDFQVSNAGPGLAGLTGSGSFFDFSLSITEAFTISDSSISGATITLLDGTTPRVTIDLDASSPRGLPNGVRVRYFAISGPGVALNSKGGADFELEMEIKAN